MKKFGLIAFIGAVVIGVATASMIPFGNIPVKDVVSSLNNSVEGSGNIVTENRPVEDFSAVDVGGVFRVEITAGKEFSVNVEADDNLLPLIQTSVNGDTLEISTDERLSSDKPILIRVTARDINEIKASGAASVSILGVKNDELRIDLSGASDLTAAGETGTLNAEISGASVIKARQLSSESVGVDASGASRAYVSASKELTAEASGASSVAYAGNPENVEKHVSGASSITAD